MSNADQHTQSQILQPQGQCTRAKSAQDSIKTKPYWSEKWAETEYGHGLSAFFLSIEVCDGTPANRHWRRSGNATYKTKHHEYGCVAAQRTSYGESEVHPISHMVDYQPSVDLGQGARVMNRGPRAKPRT